MKFEMVVYIERSQVIISKKIHVLNFSEDLHSAAFHLQVFGFPVYKRLKVKINFQRKIVIVFLHINFNICFGCSKQPYH